VCVRQFEADECTQTLRVTDPELGAQVTQLVAQLPVGNLQPYSAPVAQDTPAIEAVTAPLGFVGDAGQVTCNGRQRIACRAKALELRVQAIAACPAA
jgi:hypothetical protein